MHHPANLYVSRPLCRSERTDPPPCGGATSSQCYGGHGERETPGHIPNPEAKPFSADGTARGTGWESRTPPDITQGNGGRSIALRLPFRAFVPHSSTELTASVAAARGDGDAVEVPPSGV